VIVLEKMRLNKAVTVLVKMQLKKAVNVLVKNSTYQGCDCASKKCDLIRRVTMIVKNASL